MNPRRMPRPWPGGAPPAYLGRGLEQRGHLMLIQQAPDRLPTAGHLMPTEIDAASDLIGRAYTGDAGAPVADTVVQGIALARVARAVVQHAAAHGTVLRPTAPRLRDLAVAVWLPAEAPSLPDFDLDLVAACGPYTEQMFAHDTALRAQYGGERHDVLWFTAVHPSMRRGGVARMLLQHRHRVLASQNRRTFALAPTVQARNLLTSIGFRDHVPAVTPPGGDAPPFPMRWGRRTAWAGLLNTASGAARGGRP
jgi:GNAT superfamily N-acetyltransferase